MYSGWPFSIGVEQIGSSWPTVTPPFVVHESAELSAFFAKFLPADWGVHVSKSGYMDREGWFKVCRHFMRYCGPTRPAIALVFWQIQHMLLDQKRSKQHKLMNKVNRKNPDTTSGVIVTQDITNQEKEAENKRYPRERIIDVHGVVNGGIQQFYTACFSYDIIRSWLHIFTYKYSSTSRV